MNDDRSEFTSGNETYHQSRVGSDSNTQQELAEPRTEASVDKQSGEKRKSATGETRSRSEAKLSDLDDDQSRESGVHVPLNRSLGLRTKRRKGQPASGKSGKGTDVNLLFPGREVPTRSRSATLSESPSHASSSTNPSLGDEHENYKQMQEGQILIPMRPDEVMTRGQILNPPANNSHAAEEGSEGSMRDRSSDGSDWNIAGRPGSVQSVDSGLGGRSEEGEVEAGRPWSGEHDEVPVSPESSG